MCIYVSIYIYINICVNIVFNIMVFMRKNFIVSISCAMLTITSSIVVPILTNFIIAITLPPPKSQPSSS